MIYEIANVAVSGKEKVVSATATFQVRAVTDGDIIFSEQLNVKKRVNAPSGWYVQAKQELLSQLNEAKGRYDATMGSVVAETGMDSTVAIEADIKTTLDGGLV